MLGDIGDGGGLHTACSVNCCPMFCGLDNAFIQIFGEPHWDPDMDEWEEPPPLLLPSTLNFIFKPLKDYIWWSFFFHTSLIAAHICIITYQILLSQFHGTSITKDNNIRYYRTQQNLDNKH